MTFLTEKRYRTLRPFSFSVILIRFSCEMDQSNDHCLVKLEKKQSFLCDTERSETSASSAGHQNDVDSSNSLDPSDEDVLNMVDEDELAYASVDDRFKYFRCSEVEVVSKGSVIEECIYRGHLDKSGSNIEQVILFINKLFKTHIKHNNHVKRIACNDVTDKLMVVAEMGSYVHIKNADDFRDLNQR